MVSSGTCLCPRYIESSDLSAAICYIIDDEISISDALFYHYVLDFAKGADCYNVTLNVWALNENARKFYEKCGLSVLKIGMEKIL